MIWIVSLTEVFWRKINLPEQNNKVAIILYYKWNTNGRAHISKNLYESLNYESLVYCVREESFPRFRKEENVKIWNGPKNI